jgi:putative ABC transport system permease protein
MGRFGEIFLQDLRYSARAIVSNPGFFTVLILTLAVAISANTAIFSVVNAVLIRPLPLADPDSLVAVVQTLPQQGIFDTGTSYPNFLDLREQNRAFQDIAAIRNHSFTLTGSGEAIYINGATVSSNLFSLLQVSPAQGRAFVSEDDNLDAAPVALIGETLWRQRFNGDHSIVGKTIDLENQPYTVVGIMPSSFRFPYSTSNPQIWIPLTKDTVVRDLLKRRKGHYLEAVARLKPGISLAQGQAELAMIVDRLAATYPNDNAGSGVRIMRLQDRLVGDIRTPLLLLWGAVGLVLLIAGTNIANLLIGRATSRARELALRTALGASRIRLVRQLLTECALTGLIGGTLGFLLAYLAVSTSAAAIPSEIPRIHDIRVDGWVLIFTLMLSVAASILIGLAPAFYFSQKNLHTTLQEGGRSGGTSKGRLESRNILVICEIALSMVLLVGSGLVLRSFQRLQRVDLGFDPSNVLTANLSLSRSQYTKPQQWTDLYTRIIERLKAAPGNPEVAAALPLPPNGSGFNFKFSIEGHPPPSSGTDYSANYSAVSADYFRVLRIPVLRGRSFAPEDTPESNKVCVISSEFAKHYFPNEDPVGKRLVFGYVDEIPREIVGIVGDVKQAGLAASIAPQMYVPYPQNPWWSMSLAIRTSIPGEQFSGTVRRELQNIDRSLSSTDLQLMSSNISQSIAQPRFRTLLFGLFGLTALFLAAVGVYGVISYFVSQRTRDIGVRLALGALPGDVLRMVLIQGIRLAAVGLAIGLIAALALGRAMNSLLFGITATDGLTLLGATLLLLLVALVACFVPARRAMNVHPIVALRHD